MDNDYLYWDELLKAEQATQDEEDAWELLQQHIEKEQKKESDRRKG